LHVNAAATLPREIAAWFDARGWRVRRHQSEMLAAADAGRHALLVADTGAGKTLAGFLPTLADFAPSRLGGTEPPEGLHTLYVSPLKALTHDVQRNLLAPIEEIGLSIRVETRSGDTPSDRKARQRARPPNVLLTTPESLSLLLSYPEAAQLFAGLKRVVIDEVHAFATGKRGDLLALSLARLQAIAPGMRRAALSATVADPDAFRGWLAPWGEIDTVALIEGEPGAEPDVSILLPQEERVPWSGHAAAWAIPQLYAAIKRHRTTLVFTNTRFLAEYLFQLLWDANEDKLPIGIHHGSLSKEARRKVEGAMVRGELRALVCTASLDLGVDWGDIDPSCRWARPRARRACSSGSAAPTTGSTSPARRCSCPATASNSSRRWRRPKRSPRANATARTFARGGSTCLRSTSWPAPAPGRFARTRCSPRSAAPCLTPGSTRKASPGCSISSPPAATRCAPTTSSAGSCASGTAPGASPIPSRRSAIG
jgi:ATP-dependent Lhr-like helicase